MKQFRTVLLSFVFSISAFCCFAQTRIVDSLKRDVLAATTKEEKVKTIFALCELGYSLHPDTLMSYAENGRIISRQLNTLHDEVQAMYYESGALTTKGLIDSSLNIANKCLDILSSGKVSDLVLQASLFNQKGRCFMRKNQYKEAIDMGYQTINAAEKSNDILLQIKGKTLIGWAYLEMGQAADALGWHLKALRTTSNTLMLEKYGILFANLALNYNSLGKTDSSFYFINKAISYSRKHENLFALSNSLAIQAQLFVRADQARFAEAPLKEVVEIRKLIGDPFYIVSDMSQLGLYYAHINEPEKGIAICNEGIAIATQYKIDTKLLFLYSSLAENYKVSGNTAKYAETLEKIISIKDSVYQKNSAQSLAEMQTKYETEKNGHIIVQQKLALVKKNYWLYGSIGLLALGIIIFYLIFSNYRKKQNLKNQLLLKEEKYLSAQAIAKAEENERKRIAADLHDNLGAYAAAIASNVDQISSDQNHETALQELKINSQSIVSQLNDTIWVLKKDNLSLTAISDRVKAFIQRIGHSYPKVNIDVTEHINSDILLPPAHAFHLYQVTKEAIINSLKHSSAKNVRVYFEGEKQWKITISDDGTGMSSLNKKMGGGNGVLNMKNRSKEAGWEINWFSDEPQGTTVVIVPTTN
jgi:signal transduction histidine kinase